MLECFMSASKGGLEVRVWYLGKNCQLSNDCMKVIDDAGFDVIPEEFADIDLIISVLFPALIPQSVLAKSRMGGINFHPAPLPQFRGFAPYTWGILLDWQYWAVTCHWMSDEIDAGDIILRRDFKVDCTRETALSLRQKAHEHTLLLFMEVVAMLVSGHSLPRKPQGQGLTYTKRAFEQERIINSWEDNEIIERKLRAFYCPPYEGARIERGE